MYSKYTVLLEYRPRSYETNVKLRRNIQRVSIQDSSEIDVTVFLLFPFPFAKTKRQLPSLTWFAFFINIHVIKNVDHEIIYVFGHSRLIDKCERWIIIYKFLINFSTYGISRTSCRKSKLEIRVLLFLDLMSGNKRGQKYSQSSQRNTV